MGSMEKAKQFLKTSETLKLYSEIIDNMLLYFIARAKKEKNQPLAEELKKLKDSYIDDFTDALEITERVYCDIFSDDELEEMIVMHSTPALEKLRGLTPKIMDRFFEKYADKLRS
jgi:hypothetical protein